MSADSEIDRLRASVAELERIIANHWENAYLIKIIGEIREATGTHKCMLSELPAALALRNPASAVHMDW